MAPLDRRLGRLRARRGEGDGAGIFAAHVEDPDATLLVTDAPVVLAGRTIGRVFMVEVERPPPRMPRVAAAFRADPRLAPTLAAGRVELAMRGSRAYLVVVRD